MFKSNRNTSCRLLESLRTLGDAVTVYELEDAWLVVGPTGVFALTEDSGNLLESTTRAADLASSVRRELSDTMAWIPFVDAMCVTSADSFDHEQPCLVIPVDLVASTVSEGPENLDPDSLEALRNLPYPVAH